MHRRQFIATCAAAGLIPGLANAAAPPLAGLAGGSPAQLGTLAAVTITAPDIDLMEALYASLLVFKTVSRGKVSAAVARAWKAPAVAGRRVTVMHTEHDKGPVFRFVEQADGKIYRPLTTLGWNAAEFSVQDPDKLARQMRGSAFKIIGEPKELDKFPGMKAMQVLGPVGEVLYFTHFPETPGSPRPSAPVDYCFVAVLGAPDMPGALKFYQDRFGNRPGATFKISNPLMSWANHQPLDTEQTLSTISLGKAAAIEVDQMLANAPSRSAAPGGLPSGIAIVTFEYPQLDLRKTNSLPALGQDDISAWQDRSSTTLMGRAGERIELTAPVG